MQELLDVLRMLPVSWLAVAGGVVGAAVLIYALARLASWRKGPRISQTWSGKGRMQRWRMRADLPDIGPVTTGPPPKEPLPKVVAYRVPIDAGASARISRKHLAARPPATTAAEDEDEDEEEAQELRMAALVGLEPSPARKALEAEAGKLAYQVPTDMRKGRCEIVEVRLGRPDAKGILTAFEGRSPVVEESLPIVQTMTVELIGSAAAFLIEKRYATSTQSVTPDAAKRAGLNPKEFGLWQWHVTPRKAGTHDLFIKVSAMLDSGPAALPDRIFKVQVRVNYAEASIQVAKWAGGGLMSFLIAGLIGAATQDLWWPKLKLWLGL